MKKIKLNIKQSKQNYKIIIRSNIISNFSKFIKMSNLKITKYFFVVDKNVPNKMIQTLHNSLNSEKKYLREFNCNNTDSTGDIDFGRSVPFPKDRDEEKEWYNWRIENWGTQHPHPTSVTRTRRRIRQNICVCFPKCLPANTVSPPASTFRYSQF